MTLFGKCRTAANSAAILSPASWQSLLDLEVEAIKRQNARLKKVKKAEAPGKLAVEIVGKEHDMNYKKIMRYIWLSALVSELLDKAGA